MHAGTAHAGRPLATSVAESLQQLAAIGADAAGGVTRLAWSPELFDAYRWVGERARALGLEVGIDAAGNLLGRWPGKGKALLVGSHLDTVPSGGRFDGALGVVAALHAVARLRQDGFAPDRPLWIVAFMDEEGARFGTAAFGSRAFVGEALAALGDRADDAGMTLREAMATRGFNLDRVPDAARIDDVCAFVELHIEQGPVLEAQARDIGAVSSIVGLRGFQVRMRGQAAHAGTTPMHLRRDAFAGAARVALALRDRARATAGMTANVGRVAVRPGGANVVPELADFTVDVRAQTGAQSARLGRVVEETVAAVAKEERLEYELEETFALDPVPLDPALVDEVGRAAASEGATTIEIASGAGHDAMVLGRHVPAAMLFVPSRRGVSHSPAEYTSPAQLETGTRVLTSLLRRRLGAR